MKNSDDIIVVFWTKGDAITSRSIRIHKGLVNLRYGGKKPDKVIIPDTMVTHRADLKVLKKMIAYGGLVISTSGKRVK